MFYITGELREPAKLGRCIVCGDKIEQGSDHLTTVDGYCHRDCLL